MIETSSTAVQYQSGGPHHSFMRKAVLLDRDKTLNVDPGYLNDPDKVELLPGVIQGLSRLQAAGYLFLVLTNQSGVGRGLITPEQLFSVNRRLIELLYRDHIRIERIYYCPHVDADDCRCRKPGPAMVDAALNDFQLDPAQCWLVGDRLRDLACGEHLGIPGILIGDEEGPEERWRPSAPATLKHQVGNLSEAADRILQS